jgi:hypothetical protein
VGHEIQCIQKVAVHLGYSTYIWLSVSKLPLKCAVDSLYSVAKQQLKCNTGKVCNCLIRVQACNPSKDIEFPSYQMSLMFQWGAD